MPLLTLQDPATLPRGHDTIISKVLCATFAARTLLAGPHPDLLPSGVAGCAGVHEAQNVPQQQRRVCGRPVQHGVCFCSTTTRTSLRSSCTTRFVLLFHNNKDEFAVVLYNTVCAFVPQQQGRVCARPVQHGVCFCSTTTRTSLQSSCTTQCVPLFLKASRS